MKKVVIIWILFFISIQAEEYRRVVELSGAWKFEIGDNMNWSKYDFDDEHWEFIKAPSDWESEGFPGYDGYAWYRKKFIFSKQEGEGIYYLRLGAIDDSDMTFVNGKLVGQTGGFPPNYYTGYSENGRIREYKIPQELLINGENVISIRVYDEGLQGGLRYGNIELGVKSYGFRPIIDLAGKWKFKTGDNKNWLNTEYNDDQWDEITAPAFWENQNYEGYDGFAWYRKSFLLNQDYKDQNVILLLGKIDDMDETYVNGYLIGSTGEMPENDDDYHVNSVDYSIVRAYYIPKTYLNYNGKNQIAIRVFDGYKDGGIYNGPLAIVNRQQYRSYLEHRMTTNQPKDFHKKFNIQSILDKIYKIDK